MVEGLTVVVFVSLREGAVCTHPCLWVNTAWMYSLCCAQSFFCPQAQSGPCDCQVSRSVYYLHYICAGVTVKCRCLGWNRSIKYKMSPLSWLALSHRYLTNCWLSVSRFNSVFKALSELTLNSRWLFANVPWGYCLFAVPYCIFEYISLMFGKICCGQSSQ